MASDSYDYRLLFLGGFQDIGKSCLLIESEKSALVIDCGVDSFSNSQDLYPHLEKLTKKTKKKIKALVLTHGHDDHIGGVPYFLELFPTLPVYCSRVTAQFLKIKYRCKYEFTVVNHLQKISIDEFYVTFFDIPHSIPGAFSLQIQSDNFSIFHTGDFCFDGWPVLPDWLTSFSYSGCPDLMLLDSTSSPSKERKFNEYDLSQTIGSVLQEGPEVIFAACFSSHLTRIKTILNQAMADSREIYISGRSMRNAFIIGRNLGLPEFLNKFQDYTQIEYTDNSDKRILVLVSGSQGEADSFLDKVITDKINIPEDSGFLLSSDCIPGNEKQYRTLLNRLSEKTRDLYIDPEYTLHTSGHAGKTEIIKLLKIINPKTVLPVHGEPFQRRAAERVILEAGCVPLTGFQEGEYIEWSRQDGFKKGEIIKKRPPRLADEILKERVELCENGILVVFIPRNGREIGDPSFVFHGFFDHTEQKEYLDELSFSITGHLQDLLHQGIFSTRELRKEVLKLIRNRLADILVNIPIIKVNIFEIAKMT